MLTTIVQTLDANAINVLPETIRNLSPQQVQVVLGLGIVVGLANCLFGYRIFKILLAVQGFLGGAAAGWTWGSGAFGTTGGVLCAAAGAAAGALVMVLLYFIVIFLYGATMGAAIGAGVAQALGMQIQPIFLLIPAAAGGILALLLQRILIVLFTSFAGAWGAVYGAFRILGWAFGLSDVPKEPERMREFIEQNWPMVACWLGLSLVGLVVQFGWTSRRRYVQVTNVQPTTSSAAHPEAHAPAPAAVARPMPVFRVVLGLVYLAALGGGISYEYNARQLLDQASRAGTPAEAAEKDSQLVERYPFSIAVVEARRSLVAGAYRPQRTLMTPLEQRFGERFSPFHMYWLPFFAAPLAAVILLLVFLARLGRPGVAVVSLLLAAAAAGLFVVQVQYYGFFESSAVAAAGKQVMYDPTLVYIVACMLLTLAALLSLTPRRRAA